MIKNTLFKIGFILNGLMFCILSNANAKQVCDGGQVTNAAWSMGKDSQVNTLRRNLTEPRNAGVSMSEMQRRIEARISIYQPTTSAANRARLAAVIANIAVCTGHDFTYFAAVLEQESSYCRDLGARTGSGCGQLTSEAIDEMKSQMRLPGQQSKNNARQEVTDYLNATVNSCAKQLGNADIATQFNTTFSQSTPNVLGSLQGGRNLTTDILFSALTLKFFTAKQGGYIVEGEKRGGLAEYNGGGKPGYAGDVNATAQLINLRCQEDNYSSQILQRACLIGQNPEQCATAPADDGSVAI